MELMPGIHRIGNSLISNSYLILSDPETMVIDTGLPGQARRTVRYIKSLGIKPEDVKLIILTHADIDHIGCTLELKRATGAKIAIHEKDAPILRGKQMFKPYKRPQPIRGITAFVLKSLPFHPVEPDVLLQDGSLIGEWIITHTPGHTLGSICIYKPGKTIFTGDAIATTFAGKLRHVSRRVSLDVTQMSKSLTLISSLEFEAMLPGHGPPLLKGAAQRVRKFIEFGHDRT